MTAAGGSFLKDNIFLVAAVVLPVAVAGFFVLANAIPRWTVAPPAFDLVMKAARPYDSPSSNVVVDYAVSDGTVQAAVRLPTAQTYRQPWALLLFEHETMTVRELPLKVPDRLVEGESRTIVVDALAGRRVTDAAVAPDGYQLSARFGRGGGVVGELFGMGNRRDRVTLEGNGRVVTIDLPASLKTPDASTVLPVGWIVDRAER